MKYIENLLYEKTRDTKSEILFTQWSYDKKIIPKALNSISNLFPHYSLHDESHSITIINNIIRILGRDAIDKLSAIDLWLILSSSYYHDIGMIVSAQRLTDAVESKDFILFFKNLLEDTNHSLYEFAKDFKIENNKIIYANTSLSLTQHDGIKFILAEYFRRKHSTRSEIIIVNPNDEFNLASPRNVIPERIFKTLGKICSSHTKSFDDVMKLSFCEVGIDTEDMHPKFIACLLRIGDLLDLDNDRFSDVMLSTLSKIPIDTLTHKSKHMSIESFRADKNQISILAKCKDYDVAEITQHWFDYINNEITNQMSNWNKIVPSKEIGYLPSIESLKVELSPYEYIDGKNKPKFSVDTSKALDLLRGAGIYEKPEQSFREILQNAVDSTLIRVWEEHKQNSQLFNEPLSQEFYDLIKNYPITVSIKSKESDEDYKTWIITIEDTAMGLSANDLKYLMNAGSSSKNIKKVNMIRDMPKWLQPSGIFGIGFQSIFQLTDKVTIQTKDFFDEQYQEITLYSPESTKNGAILLEKKDSSHTIKPGSKVIFNYKTKINPNNYSIGHEQSYTKSVIDNYDYFSSESLDVEIAYVIDEIVKFSSNSYFPIKLSIDNEPIEISREEKKKPFKYYNSENYLEMNIFPNDNLHKYSVNTFYKNQLVEKNNLSIKFIGLSLNIHTDSANKVLTLNRNEIKKEYRETLAVNLFKALFQIIIKNYADFNADQQIYLSMFLDYYSNDNNLQDFNVSSFKEYENLKFDIDGNKKTITELLNMDEIQIKYSKDNTHFMSSAYEVNNNTFIINIKNYSSFDETMIFLFHKAKEKFTSIEVLKNNNIKTVTLSKKTQGNPYSEEEYKNIIASLNEKLLGFNRVYLPCMIKKYHHLRLQNNAFVPWAHWHTSLLDIMKMPRMLSPFINKNEKSEVSINNKLFNWVYDNRYDRNTSKDEIIASYKEFENEYNQFVSDPLKKNEINTILDEILNIST